MTKSRIGKRIRIALFGIFCGTCGWMAGHYGFQKANAAESTGAAANPKGVTNLYGQVLKVRSPEENQFSAQSKKYGLEVYKDENNGNLVYVSETGSISVMPGK